MKLTRRETLIGAAAATCAAPAFAQARNQYALVPMQVADGLWMVEGSTEYFTPQNGGAIVNCALLETDTGVLVIDSGPSLRYGAALKDLCGSLHALGAAAVVNTHHHPDHFFGNQAFEGLPIYALAETRDLAKTHGDGFADNLYRLLGDWMRGTEPTPPNQALASSLLTVGGRSLEVIPMAGHSEADLVLKDQRSGVIIAGDLAFLDRAPTTPSADLQVWRDNLDILQGIEASAILPGHGPFDPDGRSLTQTAAYLNWLSSTLTEAAHGGLDMVEIMQLPLPPEIAQMGAMPQELHRSVAHLFSDFERAAMPVSKGG